MKYRHGFHAGNFADVHKHVTLLALLTTLKKKDKGFLYLDTHAGRGSYDLSSPSLEAAAGIGRFASVEHSAPELRGMGGWVAAAGGAGALFHRPAVRADTAGLRARHGGTRGRVAPLSHWRVRGLVSDQGPAQHRQLACRLRTHPAGAGAGVRAVAVSARLAGRAQRLRTADREPALPHARARAGLAAGAPARPGGGARRRR